MTLTPIDRGDRSTQLAATRTDLALERSGMACERTLMAWIRTALSMISFGFTMGKLRQVLQSEKVSVFGREMDVLGVALYLVILGTLALALAVVQYTIAMRRLHLGSVHRFGLAFFIAVLLSLLGTFVLTDLARQL
jgi:putative membrane protein